MSIIEEIVNVIAPHICVGCGREGFVLCGVCAGQLPALPPRCYRCGRADAYSRTCAPCRTVNPLYQVFVAARYEEVAKAAVHALKFARAKAAARDIARAMALAVVGDEPWVVSHAPTAAGRARARGYDQAQLVARELARLLQAPYCSLLARSGAQRQVGQNRAARRAQMAEVFRCTNVTAVQHARILLVDDVLTTGATCEAAARVLRAAGARRVSVAVFAAA